MCTENIKYKMLPIYTIYTPSNEQVWLLYNFHEYKSRMFLKHYKPTIPYNIIDHNIIRFVTLRLEVPIQCMLPAIKSDRIHC